jgi:hypothetical protein
MSIDTYQAKVKSSIWKAISQYELLRKAWLTARKKYGLIFREEM